MFGIGTSELILILVLALLVIGPKELPRIGREVGRVFRNFQKAADDVKESITREIDIVGKEVDDAVEKGEGKKE
ncbi:MAG: twin arginine-targeting protein translocase TatB [Nitrospirae bacterium RIFCSPLOW2_12_42_9]|nr:MAG: twin arginine-targeting protein translocase TatB [Nitrospirae bacterium RIFCSPLOWO2_02_42_7]OGW58498.1 MAG: twin arginine-targeting protein translocase TatB [Nitrospirae bacterium RIFCSPLOW2_12_42_9]OGW59084.1 MAG: twin arginine-targeting protein translocase TatB [Nitrospirae bacterium RIFCSPHIGHO2_02_FULL_42_12]